MIIGIGSDLTNITRIQRTLDRFGDRFRDRVFTVIEKEKAARKKIHQKHLLSVGRQKRHVQKLLELDFEWGSLGKKWK